MADLIRDAPIGQMIRFVTRNRVLQYPEERPDFQCPLSYSEPDVAAKVQRASIDSPASTSGALSNGDLADVEKAAVKPTEPEESPVALDRRALERVETSRSDLERAETVKDLEKQETMRSALSRVSTRAALEQSRTRAELEDAFRAATLEKEPTRPIIPQRTSDGNILVDWYTEGDLENPQNWSNGKKAISTFMICLYTLAVYMASAIYTPSIPGVIEDFGVSIDAASLGLSLYVLAYGTGPLIFAPLSEIPSIGRNPPYMITMGIFVILSIPTALVTNFPGFVVLRFLQGFFGSPCLATGGASLQDMYSLIKLPYVICLWAFAATCGPAMGPIISGFSVPAEGWRWSMWEIVWLAGPIFVGMLLFLPETYSPNILLRRAKRLRKLTGDSRLKAQSEIDQANMKAKDVAIEALTRPFQLIFMDPAIGFTAGYVALCYAIYYSFFEAFPLVYMELYGFNLGQMGLTFISITVAVILSIICYYIYIYKVTEPEIRKFGLGAPERRLIPALPASIMLPVGLFIFGWTGNGSIHWIVSVIGVGIFTFGVFILMQCIFLYLPMVYPQYAASLFAGNDFARSVLAFAAVMFSRPMYIGMDIGPGTSLLGALTAACILGIFYLYKYGDRLRARSRFSAK